MFQSVQPALASKKRWVHQREQQKLHCHDADADALWLTCRSVTDLRPRKLDVEQCTLLCNLAELVARGVESGSSYITDSLANPQHTADQSTPSGKAAAAAV